MLVTTTSAFQLGGGWNLATQQTNTQVRKNGNQYAIYQNQIVTSVGFSQGGSKLIYLNGTTYYIDFTVYTANTTSETILQGNSTGSGTYFSASLMTTGVGATGSQGTTGTQGADGNSRHKRVAGNYLGNRLNWFSGYDWITGNNWRYWDHRELRELKV
jgi:hypothetical protein